MNFYVQRLPDDNFQVEFYLANEWMGGEICEESELDEVVLDWRGQLQAHTATQIFHRPIDMTELLSQLIWKTVDADLWGSQVEH